MDAENVKNELNNGRWEQGAQETMQDTEKMEQLKGQKMNVSGNPALRKVKESLCLLFRYLGACVECAIATIIGNDCRKSCDVIRGLTPHRDIYQNIFFALAGSGRLFCFAFQVKIA